MTPGTGRMEDTDEPDLYGRRRTALSLSELRLLGQLAARYR